MTQLSAHPGIGETEKGVLVRWGSQALALQTQAGTSTVTRYARTQYPSALVQPVCLPLAGTVVCGIGQSQGREGLRDVWLHHEDGPVFVLGTRDLGPCLLGAGGGGSSRYTAVDSGAITAGRKGERLGWRNFKDCCRQEGLGTPWSGQSSRSNPIAACLEEWRGMGWGGGVLKEDRLLPLGHCSPCPSQP